LDLPRLRRATESFEFVEADAPKETEGSHGDHEPSEEAGDNQTSEAKEAKEAKETRETSETAETKETKKRDGDFTLFSSFIDEGVGVESLESRV